MSVGEVLARQASAAETARRPKSGLGRLALAGLALAAGLAAAGWYGYDWWIAGRFLETTDDAYAGGNITAISPHVAGFVERILVSDNQEVRAGQLLIRLDPRDFRAALDRADAIVGQRQAALASLEAKELLQHSVIHEAEAALAAKSAQAVFAQQDAIRYRRLAQSSVGSRQNAEKAWAVDQAAQSAVTAARAALAAARQQLAVLTTGIAEAHAAVAQAEADVQTARLDLGYTEIRSPIDGFIGNRAAQVGAYVASGAYLLTVIPAHRLWVDANFKEDQLARMLPGERATVIADALPGHVFHGRVESLAPGTGAIFSVIPPENATGNFTKIVQRVPVRIALDPGDPLLRDIRPGLSTTVSVDTRREAGRVP